MDNISIEQIVKVNPPKYAKFLKIGMIVLCIVSLFLIFIPYVIIMTAALIIFTVIMFRYYDAEYEYTLVEREMTIDRIISKSYRRRCGIYNIGRLEIMAPYGSDKLINSEKRKCKTYNYSSNTDLSKTYVIFALCNNEMVKIILEPNEKMKENIWKIAPSKVIL